MEQTKKNIETYAKYWNKQSTEEQNYCQAEEYLETIF